MSLTALLKILQRYGFTDRCDSRSLMETPRQTSELIRNVAPGQYIHIGIGIGVLYTLKENVVD